MMKQYFLLLMATLLLACSSKQPSQPPKEQPHSLNLTTPPKSVELFGKDFISTGLYERDIAIAPDGQEIIYTLGAYQQQKRGLVSSQQTAQGWSTPEFLNISGTYQDIEPFFSADGQTLYFASNRPLLADSAAADYNIWYSKKTKQGWGEPVAFGPAINTNKDEFYPSVAQNGNLYFTATKTTGVGREDIYVSKWVDGVYQEAQLLDTAINTKAYEFNAFISPQEDVLVFSSYGRADDLGGGDLYYSQKDEAGNWKKAVHLEAPINSKKLDYCPFIDFKNKRFYFTSERVKEGQPLKKVQALLDYANSPQNGMGDIYVVGLEELGWE